MKNVRLGMVGFGRMGRIHAENITLRMKGAELYAAYGSHEGRLRDNQERYDIARITTDFDEFLAMDELDGLILASASTLHYEHLTRAIRAGVRNIFIEKPIALTAHEIASLRDLLPETTVRIQVGHHRRYDPSYIDARARIAAGELGQIISVRNDNRDYYFDPEFYRRFSPKSGGTIVDAGSHDYDMVRWLTGAEATTIYGLGGAYVYDFLPEFGDVDNAALMMEFDNGMMGQFSYSRNTKYGYHVETEIYGTDGVLRVCTEPLNNRLVSIDDRGMHKTYVKDFYDLYKNCYYDEISDFIDMIRNETREPSVSAEDGIRSVTWALGATEAVRERKVIRL